MEVWQIIVTIILIAISAILTILILSQEGKTAGLGSLTGQNTDSYWQKNKGRSKEGRIIRATAILVGVFFGICILLNISSLR